MKKIFFIELNLKLSTFLNEVYSIYCISLNKFFLKIWTANVAYLSKVSSQFYELNKLKDLYLKKNIEKLLVC